MAGIDPNEPPETLKMSDIEKRAERKHRRPHKYSGVRVSLEEAKENGVEVADIRNDYAEIESAIFTEQTLATLTELQRFCFVEVRMKGRTQQAVADEIGKARETVKYAIEAAKKNLIKYFS